MPPNTCPPRPRAWGELCHVARPGESVTWGEAYSLVMSVCRGILHPVMQSKTLYKSTFRDFIEAASGWPEKFSRVLQQNTSGQASVRGSVVIRQHLIFSSHRILAEEGIQFIVTSAAIQRHAKPIASAFSAWNDAILAVPISVFHVRRLLSP